MKEYDMVILINKVIVKGIEKNKIETATNALKEGLSPELIAKITNLSIEEVKPITSTTK